MKIHLATDHAGLDLKNAIKAYLIQNSHDVTFHVGPAGSFVASTR